MTSPLIYLAGPDVFELDSMAAFEYLKQLCSKYGLEGISPFDGEACLVGSGDEIAESIYKANIAIIKRSSAVLANVAPFRNKLEPDSGTVFEIGFAAALGKPVAAYNVVGLLESRITAECGVQLIEGQPFDLVHGYLIESFSQGMNLMISRSASLHDSAEDAVRALANKLRQN